MPKHRRKIQQNNSSIVNDSITFDDDKLFNPSSANKEYNLTNSQQQSKNGSRLHSSRNKENQLNNDQTSSKNRCCQKSMQQSLIELYNAVINYLQCDRVFDEEQLRGIIGKQICIPKKKYQENYWETYEERQKKFGYTYEQVLAEKIKEQEKKQKDYWTEFKRFICCQGANELEDIDEMWTEATAQSTLGMGKQNPKSKQFLKSQQSLQHISLNDDYDDDRPKDSNIFQLNNEYQNGNNRGYLYENEMGGGFTGGMNDQAQGARIRKGERLHKKKRTDSNNSGLIEMKRIEEAAQLDHQYQHPMQKAGRKTNKNVNSTNSMISQKVKVRINQQNNNDDDQMNYANNTPNKATINGQKGYLSSKVVSSSSMNLKIGMSNQLNDAANNDMDGENYASGSGGQKHLSSSPQTLRKQMGSNKNSSGVGVKKSSRDPSHILDLKDNKSNFENVSGQQHLDEIVLDSNRSGNIEGFGVAGSNHIQGTDTSNPNLSSQKLQRRKKQTTTMSSPNFSSQNTGALLNQQRSDEFIGSKVVGFQGNNADLNALTNTKGNNKQQQKKKFFSQSTQSSHLQLDYGNDDQNNWNQVQTQRRVAAQNIPQNNQKQSVSNSHKHNPNSFTINNDDFNIPGVDSQTLNDNNPMTMSDQSLVGDSSSNSNSKRKIRRKKVKLPQDVSTDNIKIVNQQNRNRMNTIQQVEEVNFEHSSNTNTRVQSPDNRQKVVNINNALSSMAVPTQPHQQNMSASLSERQDTSQLDGSMISSNLNGAKKARKKKKLKGAETQGNNDQALVFDAADQAAFNFGEDNINEDVFMKRMDQLKQEGQLMPSHQTVGFIGLGGQDNSEISEFDNGVGAKKANKKRAKKANLRKQFEKQQDQQVQMLDFDDGNNSL